MTKYQRRGFSQQMREKVYKNYILAVLMVIMAFNFVDRVALGLLLQDIKRDLHLSDTQLGFMTGIAFAFFYSTMGIPIARWAVSGNRVTIIALTTAVWSVMVALCGRAANFSQLLLIRIGVGIGEAGCIPPANSLIADLFSRAERPRASAAYQMGVPLSLLIGYFLAGRLNGLYGWRITFMLLALPGLVLSALVWFTLKEPRLKTSLRDASSRSVGSPCGAQRNVTPPPVEMSFREVCIALWACRSFRHLLTSFSVCIFLDMEFFNGNPPSSYVATG